jgi:hypothetical protein
MCSAWLCLLLNLLRVSGSCTSHGQVPLSTAVIDEARDWSLLLHLGELRFFQNIHPSGSGLSSHRLPTALLTGYASREA